MFQEKEVIFQIKFPQHQPFIDYEKNIRMLLTKKKKNDQNENILIDKLSFTRSIMNSSKYFIIFHNRISLLYCLRFESLVDSKDF